MTRHVLGVFAKAPVAGQVKTRLAAATSPAFAAAVAEAFLHDTLSRLQDVDAHKLLVYSPTDAGEYFRTLAAARALDARSQGEGDLGARLERFFSFACAAQSAHVVAVGSDSPTLPVQYVRDAFAALADADVVLGPATDGGYYLIGCGAHDPSLFTGIAWSEPAVLAQTVARVRGRLALLPPWYDVDTHEDWQMLCGHVAACRRAGLDPGVPRTEAVASPDFRA